MGVSSLAAEAKRGRPVVVDSWRDWRTWPTPLERRADNPYEQVRFLHLLPSWYSVNGEASRE